MKKEYFVCDLCDRTANEEMAIFGIRIAIEYDGNTVDLRSDPRQSTKHICEECLAALDMRFNPKGEDVKI